MRERDHGQERLTEAAFCRMLAGLAAGILLCLAGLAGTTWALFDTKISSGPNTIQIAAYSAEMSIERVTDKADGAAGQEADVSAGSASASEEISSVGDYRVTLTLHTGSEAATGCCMLTVQVDGEPDGRIAADQPADQSEDQSAAGQENAVFYTRLLQSGGTVTFPLHIQGSRTVTLTVSPCWGIPSTGESAGILTAAGLTVTAAGLAVGEEPSAESESGTVTESESETSETASESETETSMTEGESETETSVAEGENGTETSAAEAESGTETSGTATESETETSIPEGENGSVAETSGTAGTGKSETAQDLSVTSAGL